MKHLQIRSGSRLLRCLCTRTRRSISEARLIRQWPAGISVYPQNTHVLPNHSNALAKRWFSSHHEETPTADESPTSPHQPTEANPMADSERIIDVAPLADQMRSRVRRYTHTLKSEEEVRLVGILAEEGPYRHDTEMYSRRIAEAFQEDGVHYEECRCSGTSLDAVEATIRDMNARNEVHGILVFYPIFKGRIHQSAPKTYISKSGVYYKTGDDYLRDIVHPSKDVEGLHRNYHARNMFRARSPDRIQHKGGNNVPSDVYIPCTALAVTRILDAYALAPQPSSHMLQTDTANNNKIVSPPPQQKWSGCTVTILNRSEILGRPLAALLALQGATVYSVDESSILVFFDGGRMRRCSSTVTKEDCLAQSSIVVTGVPTPDFVLDPSIIPAHALVINVSEFPNVDEHALLQRDEPVSYVPHVGKVTVAALEENLIRLHQQHLMQGPNGEPSKR